MHAPQPGGPAIEVRDLRKRYGALEAVRHLDLTVDRGEVVGLLGPNGAGKTTTVEILEGYRRPDGGSVRVLGLDPVDDGRELRPRIGVMLQDGGLHPGLRVAEVLRCFAAFYPDPEDPSALLERLGLVELRRRFVRRLSGGQRQRLSLACALVGRPEVLFLDEPTAGMDPRARTNTWDLVRDLRSAGVTVVLTTHDMVEAERLCDRVVILDRGTAVAEGSPAALRSALSGDLLRFRSSAAIDTAALAAALDLPPEAVAEERPGEYRVQGPTGAALVAGLAGWLADKGFDLLGISTGHATLEDVFLRLTAEDGEAGPRP